MVDYIARYVLRDREIIVKYTAENDDESIKLANSVCEKLGERDIEEVIIGKIVGTITGAIMWHSISEDNSITTAIFSAITNALIGHIVDNLIVKEIYSKKYPCIRPRQLSDLHKYIDIRKLEDAVNAR